jgi:GTPase SAR1 family protein
MASYKHHKKLLTKKCFDVFFPSFESKRVMNDAIVMVGKKRSGKTSLALYFIKLYHKFRPKDNIHVFTQVPDNYDQVKKLPTLLILIK